MNVTEYKDRLRLVYAKVFDEGLIKRGDFSLNPTLIEYAVRESVKFFFKHVTDNRPHKLHELLIQEVEYALFDELQTMFKNKPDRVAKIVGLTQEQIHEKLEKQLKNRNRS